LQTISSTEFLGEISEKGEILPASWLEFLLLEREIEQVFFAPNFTLGDDEEIFQIRPQLRHVLGKASMVPFIGKCDLRLLRQLGQFCAQVFIRDLAPWVLRSPRTQEFEDRIPL